MCRGLGLLRLRAVAGRSTPHSRLLRYPRSEDPRRWCRNFIRGARPFPRRFSWSIGRAVPGILPRSDSFSNHSSFRHSEDSPTTLRYSDSVPQTPRRLCLTSRAHASSHGSTAAETPTPDAGLAYLYSQSETPLIGPKWPSLIGPSLVRRIESERVSPLAQRISKRGSLSFLPDILVGISPHPSTHPAPGHRYRATRLSTADRSPRRFQA